jgi:hypothetical protein
VDGDAQRFGRVLLSGQRFSAIRALIDGLVVVIRLRRRGLGSLLDNLPDSDSEGAVEEVRRVALAVDAGLAMLPVAFTCLRRSTVLLRELRRQELGATLRIGVKRGSGGFEAHAWVQVGDNVVNDDPALVRCYVPMPSHSVDVTKTRFR